MPMRKVVKILISLYILFLTVACKEEPSKSKKEDVVAHIERLDRPDAGILNPQP